MPAPPTLPGPGGAVTGGALPVRGVALLQSLSSRADVATQLGVTWQQLAWILFKHGKVGYYRTWTIKKKRGEGTREIRAPQPALWRVQKALLPVLQDAYKPRSAAHAYVPGRNVRTNAEDHVGSRYVLNVDLVDFFPSINFGRVRGLFLAEPFHCDEKVATLLAQICCSDGALPIGACTSPLISNMICRRLDRELQQLAHSLGCRYTRYADDITFSTKQNRFPGALAQVDPSGEIVLGPSLSEIIRLNGFSPNKTKTRLQRPWDRQLVAGVIVNERLNVDRRFIRNIRAMLHNWDTKKLPAVQAELAAKYDHKDRYPGAAPDFLRVLRGRIAYLAMIRDPSDVRARVFLDQYENLRAGRPINHGIDYLPEQPHRATEPLERRRVVTVMFTDLVDSTARSMELGDDEWHKRVEAHFGRAESQTRRHGGSPIKTIGDANLATFPNPSTAIHCAQAIVASERLNDAEIRIGLHTGEIGHVQARNDIDGIGVALAARVEAVAGPYEILVTETVKDLVMGGQYSFEDRGLHELKGIGRKRLFAVTDVSHATARDPWWRWLGRSALADLRRLISH